MDNKYTFTHNDDHIDVSITIKEHHISDVIRGFKQFLLACTFSEQTINQYLKIESENEYN